MVNAKTFADVDLSRGPITGVAGGLPWRDRCHVKNSLTYAFFRWKIIRKNNDDFSFYLIRAHLFYCGR
jgi:hypothetical protein